MPPLTTLVSPSRTIRCLSVCAPVNNVSVSGRERFRERHSVCISFNSRTFSSARSVFAPRSSFTLQQSRYWLSSTLQCTIFLLDITTTAKCCYVKLVSIIALSKHSLKKAVKVHLCQLSFSKLVEYVCTGHAIQDVM